MLLSCIQIKKTEECLHNQICVLKPNSLLFLLCIFIVFVRCVVCLLMCVSLFETLKTMFDLSVGGGVNKLFLHEFRGMLSPITSNVVFIVSNVVFTVLSEFDKNSKNCSEKPKKSRFCVFCVLGYLPTQ